MRSTAVRFLAAIFIVLPISTWFLCGCAPVTSPTTGGNFSTRVLTGNWTFGPTDPPAGSPPFGQLTGALSGSGATVTGTFRTVGCVSSTQDIHFTGSQTASGMLTLTSTDLVNNVMVITVDLGDAIAIAAPLWLGGMTVSGSGPCAYADIAMQVKEYLPLTGSYSGTVTGSAGATATYAASLTQSAANADGQFPESGSITVSTSSCSTTYPISGLVAGPALTASLSSATGASAGNMGATLTTGSTTMPFTLNVTSGCTTGLFGGFLGSS
jgi:hypothetical protein